MLLAIEYLRSAKMQSPGVIGDCVRALPRQRARHRREHSPRLCILGRHIPNRMIRVGTDRAGKPVRARCQPVHPAPCATLEPLPLQAGRPRSTRLPAPLVPARRSPRRPRRRGAPGQELALVRTAEVALGGAGGGDPVRLRPHHGRGTARPCHSAAVGEAGAARRRSGGPDARRLRLERGRCERDRQGAEA